METQENTQRELLKLKTESQIFKKEILRLRKRLNAYAVDTENSLKSKHSSRALKGISSELGAVLFEQLFNNDPDGVILTDKEGHIITANPAYIAQLGADYENVTGAHIADFLQDPGVFTENIEKLKKTGYIEGIVKQVSATGKLSTLERKVVLINLPSDDFLVLIISKNITERLEQEEERAKNIKKLHDLNHELYSLNQTHETVLAELGKSHKALEIAYKKLEESEKKYRLISENTGDYIFTVKIDQKEPVITYAAASVHKLGYSPEELKGSDPLKYIHPEDRNKSRLLIERYYYQFKEQNKLSFDEEIHIPLRILTQNKKILHLESTLNFSSDSLIVVAKDITDLIKEMEVNEKQKQKLLKIKKSYRNIYNSASDIFIVLDNQLNILDINKAVTDVLSYSIKEVKNQKLSEILDIENWQEYMTPPVLSDEYSAQKRAPHYMKAFTKTGKSIWVSAVFRRTTYNEQNAFFLVLRNIDELKKAQDSLAESEQKFRMLAESGASGILIYRENKFVYSNKTIQEITGYKEDELLEKNFWEVVHPDMQELVKQRGIKRLAGEKVKSKYEIKLLTKSGELRWIEFSAKRIHYQGKPAAIGNVVDITNYKKTIKKWKAAKEQAEESDRLKSAFLSNMSHEIRTPMNGILGFAQLLNTDNLDAQTRKHYTGIIKNSSNQLLRIIDDILDVSKLDVGQMTIQKDRYIADLILDELEEIFLQKIKDEKLNINLINAAENKGVKIYTDNVRLKQILTNLLDNAVKYTIEGTITFGYKIKEKNELLFFVKDTGCGISKDLQKYIFTRFSRLENDYYKTVRGTGLGLAISKGLVELLGGEIYFESDGKSGTEFYFTHPIEKR